MNTTVSSPKKSRGRPRVFDREDALEKAMLLFWQHGYEGTSLSHLVAATGAKAPTLYTEFTNKEGLFRAVLEHYTARFTAQYEACLFEQPGPLLSVMESFLTTMAKCFTAAGTPSGCFIICTASGLGSASQDITEKMRARYMMIETALLRFLRERQQQGELSSQCDIAAAAAYLSCIVRGLSVSARDGADYAALAGLIKTTLTLLPGLLKIT